MKNRIVLISFLLLSLIITLIWFKNGRIFAAAEEGMPFYSPEKAALFSQYVWQKDAAGYVISTFIPQYPFFFLAKTLNIFLPINITEAGFFWFIIFSGLIGVYFLVKTIIGNGLVAVISSVFYLFNLFTMSQIWHRSLFVGMFMWSFYPIFLLLFIKSLSEKGYKWILLFLLAPAFFSYSFVLPSNIFVLWFSAGLYTLFYFIKHSKIKKEKLFVFKKFLLIFLLWVFTNIWWLYPYVSLSTSTYAQFSSTDLSFESLTGVSTSFPLNQVLQLRQKFFFDTNTNKELPWGSFYESDISTFITWGGFILVLHGLIKLRKNKYWPFLLMMFLIGIFVSKGTNPPFGYTFFKWLFNTFPPMAMFRNSYEKFGLVLLLPYSIFFANGVFSISKMHNSKIAQTLIISTFIVVFNVFLTLPMWNGKVFWDYFWVDVPEYYERVDNIISLNKSDSRVLILPLIPHHGLRYSWGYRGDEPSRFLFNKQVISKKVSSPYYGDKYDEMFNSIKEKPQSLEKYLKELNVEFIILNNDIEWQAVGAQSSPDEVRDSLNKQDYIIFVEKVGNLEIYKYESVSQFKLFDIDGGSDIEVDYKMLYPGKYRVHVSNFQDRYNLILKETYHDNWQAEIRGEKVDKHFMVYDYANAWEIDKSGDYVIDVTFKVWPWD